MDLLFNEVRDTYIPLIVLILAINLEILVYDEIYIEQQRLNLTKGLKYFIIFI